MAFKRYKHLNVPDSWERYFTKYPQGMSILESLFEWVSQVDSMVDNQNKLSANVEQFRNEIDAFVGRFDERLQTEVSNTLTDWQNSGFLDVVISSALQWQLDDYIATNEQDKLSLTTQLQHTATLIYPHMTTSEVQTVLDNGGNILFADGLYKLNPIFIRSNSKVTLSPNTVIESNEGFGRQDRFVNILNVKNVTLIGNYATIRMLKAEYVDGEWRHGLNISSSENVYVENLHSNDSGGDGFAIGGGAIPSRNVHLVNCVADNNRRQGLSITSGVNITIDNFVGSNTKGTLPESGIDIEPDHSEAFMQNIVINNPHTINNAGRGVLVHLQYYKNAVNPVSIQVNNHFDNGSDVGSSFFGGETGITGTVEFNDSFVINTRGNGMALLNFYDSHLQLFVNRPSIVNCAQGNAAGYLYTTGIMVNRELNSPTNGIIGNITIRNASVIDTRATKKIERAIYVRDLKTIGVKNVNIINPIRLDGNTNKLFYSGELYTFKDEKELLKTTVSNSETTLSAFTNSTIYTDKGRTALTNVTLPLDYMEGQTFSFRNESGNVLRVRPGDGVKITPTTLQPGVVIMSNKIGSVIKLKRFDETHWIVLHNEGWFSEP